MMSELASLDGRIAPAEETYVPATDEGLLRGDGGFDEALLVTPHGRVLEAPTSSIFWVDQAGSLCTPPLDEHILASITRDRVLTVCEVEERPASVADLRDAREAF